MKLSCKTRSHFAEGRKFYGFDVSWETADSRGGIAAGWYKTRAKAVEWGQKWQAHFEAADCPPPGKPQDRHAFNRLMRATAAAMDIPERLKSVNLKKETA